MQETYPLHQQNPFLYAGFWKRTAAYIIDNILRMLAIPIILVVAALSGDPTLQGVDESDGVGAIVAIVIFVLFLALYVFYHPLFESSKLQASPGKLALGIKVVDLTGERLSFGRAFARNLASVLTWLTSIVFYFGYWMAGVTARKQALHDMMTSCLVVNKEAEVVVTGDVRYVSGGFPVWAGILIAIFVLGIPVVGILAAIAIPAYQDYAVRATVGQTVIEAQAQIQPLVLEATTAGGQMPGSHIELGHRWPEQIGRGNADAFLRDQVVVMTFNDSAPYAIRNQSLGMSLHQDSNGNYTWQCGRHQVGGRRLSQRDSAELTTLDSRYLPAECR